MSKIGPENQNYLLKMKPVGYTSLNMLNLMFM